MDDQLYRRSMGFRYDPELLKREIANGYSVGHTAAPELAQHENGFAMDESDLFIQAEGSENAIRLQEIEYELAFETSDDERAVLEAEKIVRLEQRRLDELAEQHPRYADALQEWLETEMQHLIETNVPIDDEMLAEAEILDQIIAETREEQEDQPLIKIAKVMKDVIEAQHQLEEVRSHVDHVLAA